MGTHSRLIALQDLAVEVMEEKLQTKRDGRLAALLLTKLGALSASPPGQTEPKHAAQEIPNDRRRRAVELGKAADDLERDYAIFPPKHLIKDDPPPAPEPDLPARGSDYQL